MLVIFVLGLAKASTTSGEFETYTNEDYNITIEYPSDWEEQESNLQEYEVVHFLSPDDVPGAINIFIIKALPGMSLYDMATLDNDNSDNIRIINIINTTLAGFPAVEEVYYQYEFGATTKAKEALILNENNLDLIMIRYLTEPENFDEYLPAFDHMLQSFKIGVS